MSSSPLIVVVGSINMDLVMRVSHVPSPGETILGRDFVMLPGGKGANQAVAVARLGGQAAMVGRVGDDDIGRTLLAGLKADGVDAGRVQTTAGVSSGIAMITVADSGENAITVASGANFSVTREDIDAAEELIARARLCLVQLELPLAMVEHAVNLCQRHSVEVILDPAPAPSKPLRADVLAWPLLSPNETEGAALTGLRADADLEQIWTQLCNRGTKRAVLKRGGQGCAVCTTDGIHSIKPFSVNVVDTTAAGDAFTAGLGVAIAEGLSLNEAARFANAAGALACTRLGAQTAMPKRREVEILLGQQVVI